MLWFLGVLWYNLLGNYLLKDLDANGQRLAIPITLAGKSFYTGWMLEPKGKIRNITPFGGWVKWNSKQLN